jgi:hypothetical protein
MKLMKLLIATGLGLLLFVVTMIGGPAGISRAQAGGGVTLASLAGKFETKGSGSETVCFNQSFTEAVVCASAPHQVQFKLTAVAHNIRDAAGNSCGVTIASSALTDAAVAVYAGKFPNRTNVHRTTVMTTTSFDPTTGSGTTSFRQYLGGSCIGAGFDSTGAVLTLTGTQSFMVSDSGNRIKSILTSSSAVAGAFDSDIMTGLMFSSTSIRQSD